MEIPFRFLFIGHISIYMARRHSRQQFSSGRSICYTKHTTAPSKLMAVPWTKWGKGKVSQIIAKKIGVSTATYKRGKKKKGSLRSGTIGMTNVYNQIKSNCTRSLNYYRICLNKLSIRCRNNRAQMYCFFILSFVDGFSRIVILKDVSVVWIGRSSSGPLSEQW